MTTTVSKKVEKFFLDYKLRHYEKGQILILNGDDTDYVFYLETGRVKMYDVTYRGDEMILSIFKPNSFFPMSLAINKVANPYIYEAESDISLHQAPAPDVIRFLNDNPDVILDLLSRLYHGIDGMLGRMAVLMSGSAKSRLIYELIIESRRFGEITKEGTCKLAISEKEIGAMSGLSRETVSREMRKLKNDQLITVEPKMIVIHSMPRLESLLGQVI